LSGNSAAEAESNSQRGSRRKIKKKRERGFHGKNPPKKTGKKTHSKGGEEPRTKSH